MVPIQSVEPSARREAASAPSGAGARANLRPARRGGARRSGTSRVKAAAVLSRLSRLSRIERPLDPVDAERLVLDGDDVESHVGCSPFRVLGQPAPRGAHHARPLQGSDGLRRSPTLGVAPPLYLDADDPGRGARNDVEL